MGVAHPLLLLALVWLVPLISFSLGHWPFGLLIAVGATLWRHLDWRNRSR